MKTSYVFNLKKSNVKTKRHELCKTYEMLEEKFVLVVDQAEKERY